QRDVHRGAVRGALGALERLDLGMGPAAILRPAAADDDAVLDDDGADRRVRRGAAEATAAEIEREAHEAEVVSVCSRLGRHSRTVLLPSPPLASARRGREKQNIISELACPAWRPRRVPRAPSRSPWPRGNSCRP